MYVTHWTFPTTLPTKELFLRNFKLWIFTLRPLEVGIVALIWIQWKEHWIGTSDAYILVSILPLIVCIALEKPLLLCGYYLEGISNVFFKHPSGFCCLWHKSMFAFLILYKWHQSIIASEAQSGLKTQVKGLQHCLPGFFGGKPKRPSGRPRKNRDQGVPRSLENGNDELSSVCPCIHCSWFKLWGESIYLDKLGPLLGQERAGHLYW